MGRAGKMVKRSDQWVRLVLFPILKGSKMKSEWLKHCLELSKEPAEFYSGCRKIVRGRMLEFHRMGPHLQLPDAGFTNAKLRQLQRNYHVPESRAAAQQLWKQRLEQGKYGSVGFHCYNHLVKGGGLRSHWDGVNAVKGTSKRASVMGPCIQAVNLTLLKKGEVAIDLYYRTTELYKKFPADLVFLRDDLLVGFEGALQSNCIRAHFANITLHPMYFVTIMGLLDDPIKNLEQIKKADHHFYSWIIKWTARYCCPEHHRGIAKFAQALRVQMHAKRSIEKSDMKRIQKYLRDNHPGYNNRYVAPEENEDVSD